MLYKRQNGAGGMYRIQSIASNGRNLTSIAAMFYVKQVEAYNKNIEAHTIVLMYNVHELRYVNIEVV